MPEPPLSTSIRPPWASIVRLTTSTAVRGMRPAAWSILHPPAGTPAVPASVHGTTHAAQGVQEVCMIPMIDSAVPGISTMVLTFDSSAVGALVALVAAVGLMVVGTARELRRRPEVEVVPVPAARVRVAA